MNNIDSIGIMGAMQEEIVSLKEAMEFPVVTLIGGREYISGKLFGKNAVVVFSRWGKVAAAATAATLITKFHVQCILFTGVAGAVNSHLNVGDVVIGTEVYQHDMDAAPLFPKREIPYLGVNCFKSDSKLFELASDATKSFFLHSFSKVFESALLKTFSIENPKIHYGLIASGDQFISDGEKMQALEKEVPGTLAVEMEGASVAQVCFEHEVPFVIIRTISDRADHAAPVDFSKFVSEVATHYSMGIVREIFDVLKTDKCRIS